MPSPENPDWLFDCHAIDFSIAGRVFAGHDGGAFLWESHDVGGSSRPGIDAGDLLIDQSGSKETSSQKRTRPESCSALGSKACREKIRRDKLNDKFMELGALLDPAGTPKMDKVVILSDAVCKITNLRNEAKQLKDSNQSLKEKIDELKNEKNELREEKQRLKEEKCNLERQIKTMSMRPSFLPYPPMMPYFSPVHADGSKLMMPYAATGHPGFMFQFHASASTDDRNELPPAA